MKKQESYNRVLLNEAGFIRYLKDGSKTKIIHDIRGLSYQIEELISLGASEIALRYNPDIENILKSFPSILRKRTKLIDKNKNCQNQTFAILDPIIKELSLKLLGLNGVVFQEELPEEIKSATTSLLFNLYKFLLGVEYKLQVDIDLIHLKKSVDLLRYYLYTSEARANISVISGVLNTYDTLSFNTVIINKNQSIDIITKFQEFIEDETFQYLSKESHKFGFPIYVKHSINKFNQLVKEFISKPNLKNIVNIASKSISIATKLPIPSLEIVSFSDGYLPPIIDLSNAIKRARLSYYQAINQKS